MQGGTVQDSPLYMGPDRISLVENAHQDSGQLQALSFPV
jgi:hypothetical protein